MRAERDLDFESGRTGPKRPVQPPDSHPLLDFREIGNGTHTLFVRDSESPPESKKKPKGAAFAEIHIVISDRPAATPEGASILTRHSKPIFKVEYKAHIPPPPMPGEPGIVGLPGVVAGPAVPGGPGGPLAPQVATIFARCRTATGKVDPFGPGVWGHIAYCGTVDPPPPEAQ